MKRSYLVRMWRGKVRGNKKSKSAAEPSEFSASISDNLGQRNPVQGVFVRGQKVFDTISKIGADTEAQADLEKNKGGLSKADLMRKAIASEKYDLTQAGFPQVQEQKASGAAGAASGGQQVRQGDHASTTHSEQAAKGAGSTPKTKSGTEKLGASQLGFSMGGYEPVPKVQISDVQGMDSWDRHKSDFGKPGTVSGWADIVGRIKSESIGEGDQNGTIDLGIGPGTNAQGLPTPKSWTIKYNIVWREGAAVAKVYHVGPSI